MKDFKSICMGCMGDNEDQIICPHCGYDQQQPQNSPYLPKGTLLEERYVVGRVTDQNTESVGYIGYDVVTETPVYIREFLPLEVCSRQDNNLNVEVTTYFKVDYNSYLDNFLKYFRAVARMREISAIIPIYNIFSANNTAYTVSEWVEGITLTEYVKRSGGHISWDSARPLFLPIVSAMTEISKAGLRHLGICPQNMIITRMGKMRLSGFAIREIRMSNSRLKPHLYSGCSAVEQYIEGYRVDESTDVYGFTASLFFALTGELPNDALSRRSDDRLFIPNSLIKEIPQHVIIAMANGLRVFQNSRTLCFQRLRDELSLAPSIMVEKEQGVNEPKNKTQSGYNGKEKSNKKTGLTIGIISFSVALVVLLVFSIIWLTGKSFGNSQENSHNSHNSDNQSSAIDSLSSHVSENEMNVPYLIGMNFDEAKIYAEESGDYRILLQSEEFSDEVKQGFIISQTPQNTATMKKGSSIVVVVSKGPKKRELPEISGMSLSEASLALTSAGFSPVKVEEFSGSVADGIVIGYDDKKTGDLLDYGSQVRILVSKGKS